MSVAELTNENTKQIMNAINVFARRCRIGKVRQRFTGWSDLGLSKVKVTYPSLPNFPSQRQDGSEIGSMAGRSRDQ